MPDVVHYCRQKNLVLFTNKVYFFLGGIQTFEAT